MSNIRQSSKTKALTLRQRPLLPQTGIFQPHRKLSDVSRPISMTSSYDQRSSPRPRSGGDARRRGGGGPPSYGSRTGGGGGYGGGGGGGGGGGNKPLPMDQVYHPLLSPHPPTNQHRSSSSFPHPAVDSPRKRAAR